ncbi:MAG: GAF domain-containing protein [Anaerolineae bacterium]|nr:GAF domain-containing protein [Anaerolineae bacterium]
MKNERRYAIYMMTGSLTLTLLIWLTIRIPPQPADLLPGLLFGILIVFTITFGVRVAQGWVSLMPMTAVATYLVLGLVPAGWVAFVGAIIHGAVRYWQTKRLGERPAGSLLGLIAVTCANTAIHSLSILAGGAAFQLLDGRPPLTSTPLALFLPLVCLGLAYWCTNGIVAGVHIAVRGRVALQSYLHSLPNLLLYEGAPLIFSPLMALVYSKLGVIQFVLFALVLIVASLITHSLDSASQRLERRVKELDSLQAVGRALSASLHIETIVSAIYAQTAQLMPAENFYVALFNPQLSQVSFPLAVERGEPVQWRPRQMGHGLTEHVLNTKAPLLIRQDVEQTVRGLGIEHIGQPASCWLGVPMLAGDEPLGIIAVQSYSTPRAYDVSNQNVLLTIAAQAAVAIQNARLYERTDEALSRRVQELDSILRTAGEGILLLDLDWNVLAVNRTLADFLGLVQLELIGKPLDQPQFDGKQSPITLIGYTPETFQADCKVLSEGAARQKQAMFALAPLPPSPGRHIERTLVPVRRQEGTIAGWLLFFRDITEEVELATLKDDMTHMLVHDLRSPLTAVMGSLALMKRSFKSGKEEQFDRLLEMAQNGSDRMLRMVNELLDISKLESDKLPLHPEPVSARELLQEVAIRLTSLADEAHITLELSAEETLPPLLVDPQLIGRVLNNLLDNAIKFTPDNGRIQLWAQNGTEPGDKTIQLGVTDTGPGIPLESQSRLFEMFQQIESIKGRRVGTGLGLPFCKMAVEAHGGQIWVESEVGRGSTFAMTLPIVNQETGSEE